MQAIQVGDQTFEFTANPEERCELVRLPGPASTTAVEVGPITQRLHVKVRGAPSSRHTLGPPKNEAFQQFNPSGWRRYRASGLVWLQDSWRVHSAKALEHCKLKVQGIGSLPRSTGTRMRVYHWWTEPPDEHAVSHEWGLTLPLTAVPCALQRNLADEDRERVRSRCQVAAQKSHVRKAVLLDGSRRQQRSAGPRVTVTRQPTAPGASPRVLRFVGCFSR